MRTGFKDDTYETNARIKPQSGMFQTNKHENNKMNWFGWRKMMADALNYQRNIVLTSIEIKQSNNLEWWCAGKWVFIRSLCCHAHCAVNYIIKKKQNFIVSVPDIFFFLSKINSMNSQISGDSWISKLQMQSCIVNYRQEKSRTICMHVQHCCVGINIRKCILSTKRRLNRLL